MFDPSMGLFPYPHPKLGVLRAGGPAHPSLLALTPGVRPLKVPRGKEVLHCGFPFQAAPVLHYNTRDTCIQQGKWQGFSVCACVLQKPASACVLSVDEEKVCAKPFVCFGGSGSMFASIESFTDFFPPINGLFLTAFIHSTETNESVAGSGCTAFKGIYSVSFVLVISVKNRKLFSHLIHIIDKMRN